MDVDPTVFRLAIFVLAIFVGYYVVWSVTPALHTPLMAVTNAISSVIIVGALLAVEDEEFKNAQTAGGYAKPMSKEYQAKQAELVSGHIAKQDMVITTALIPGRPAPKLVSAAQVASMRPGSVIVDLAIEQGGNVEGAKLGEVAVTKNGVKILGVANLPGRIAADASALYARNLMAFSGLFLDAEGQFAPNYEDEILKAALVTQGGAVVHPNLKG